MAWLFSLDDTHIYFWGFNSVNNHKFEIIDNHEFE